MRADTKAIDVVVRPAGTPDIPALLRLMRALAALEGHEAAMRADEATLRRDGFGPQPRYAAWLAEVDGRPVGFVSRTVGYSIWAGRSVLAVDDLYVDDAARGLGIGRRLMQAVADECLLDGHAFVRWTVELGNANAIRFYERLGATLAAKGVCTWLPPRMDSPGGSEGACRAAVTAPAG